MFTQARSILFLIQLAQLLTATAAFQVQYYPKLLRAKQIHRAPQQLCERPVDPWQDLDNKERLGGQFPPTLEEHQIALPVDNQLFLEPVPKRKRAEQESVSQGPKRAKTDTASYPENTDFNNFEQLQGKFPPWEPDRRRLDERKVAALMTEEDHTGEETISDSSTVQLEAKDMKESNNPEDELLDESPRTEDQADEANAELDQSETSTEGDETKAEPPEVKESPPAIPSRMLHTSRYPWDNPQIHCTDARVEINQWLNK